MVDVLHRNQTRLFAEYSKRASNTALISHVLLVTSSYLPDHSETIKMLG